MNKIDEDFELGQDRNFVTALARGLEVLRCFRADELSLTNTEIAQRTGLPKPTVTRLTHTLCRLDYLVHSERTGTYRLGPGVLALGFGALAGMDITDLAREDMDALCAGPNPHVTAALGAQHRLRVVYVAVRRSTQAVALTMSVGARLPLFHSSIGRAVVAGMDADTREELIRLAIDERPQDEARIRHGADKALADYAEHGFCTSFGEWKTEVNGIAVPVTSLNGDRLYSLNIGGPSFLTSPEALIEEYGDRLKAAGQAISRHAGPGA